MMFQESALYYNALYRSKNYQEEAAYIDNLLNLHRKGSKSLLDLGCGTGNHSRCFSARGFDVHGIDASEHMIAEALPGAIPGRLEYSVADMRSLALGKKFDAATALFHVMSYLVTNEDLCRALSSACNHLVEDGILIFDFWYGPAVLMDPPAVRVKRLSDKGVELLRVAEPHLQVNENTVSIDYGFFIQGSAESSYRHFNETHRMRYLFLPEIDLMLEKTGFSRRGAYAWMTLDEPGKDSWYACIVAEKKQA